VAAATVAIAALGGESTAAGQARHVARAKTPAARSTAELASRCVALRSRLNGRFIAVEANGYGTVSRIVARATALYLKPTGLGTYMLQDRSGHLVAVGAAGGVGSLAPPGLPAEWSVRRSARRTFAIASSADARQLAVDPGTGRLVLVAAGTGGPGGRFEFVPARGCTPFPEAQIGASGPSVQRASRDESVFGFSDVHLHITADMRAGGSVIYGESFDRFGITEALGHDENDHGPDGSLDVTGNLLRSGSPVGTHDTHGWPTFAGWPVHDTYTHQQTYYVWLERMWKAGLRLVVAQTVEDQSLCEIEPLRSHSCDETDSIKLQIQRLRAMQDYIDAQSGGSGTGWFRIVTDPRQAREVIRAGKLAVVIGIESSNPLGCSEFEGIPQCSTEDIDRRLDEYGRLGVRSMFIAHWTDNALAGAAFEGGATGRFISGLQVVQTGQPFMSEPCTDGDEADGQCNARGLTDLGRYLVEQMMARHMLIDVDHLSQKARRSVLTIAEGRRYPLISSHTGTGGEWTPAQLKELYALGGLASITPATAAKMLDKMRELQSFASPDHLFGAGLGTDTGGFNALPGADAATTPLRYPFRSYDGEVTFARQRTGERTYDLNRDGVAHYGLFADLIADMQQQPGGTDALRPFFRSAEAYLEMWQRANGAS